MNTSNLGSVPKIANQRPTILFRKSMVIVRRDRHAFWQLPRFLRHSSIYSLWLCAPWSCYTSDIPFPCFPPQAIPSPFSSSKRRTYSWSIHRFPAHHRPHHHQRQGRAHILSQPLAILLTVKFVSLSFLKCLAGFYTCFDSFSDRSIDMNCIYKFLIREHIMYLMYILHFDLSGRRARSSRHFDKRPPSSNYSYLKFIIPSNRTSLF